MGFFQGDGCIIWKDHFDFYRSGKNLYDLYFLNSSNPNFHERYATKIKSDTVQFIITYTFTLAMNHTFLNKNISTTKLKAYVEDPGPRLTFYIYYVIPRQKWDKKCIYRFPSLYMSYYPYAHHNATGFNLSATISNIWARAINLNQ